MDAGRIPPEIYSVEVEHGLPVGVEGNGPVHDEGHIMKTTQVDVEQGQVDG